MASAVKNKETVTVPVVTYETKTVDEIVLTLTPDEALTLARVCTLVGGQPEGRRGHVDSIAVALSGAGVELPRYYYKNNASLGDLRVEGHVILADPDGTLPRERVDKTSPVV
jgi:hypothetical protein